MVERYISLRDRKKIETHTKYAESERSYIMQRKQEKLYDYYICDYCGEEIKILDKHLDMDGGIATFPMSLTKREKIKVALHNRCLRLAIAEFSK